MGCAYNGGMSNPTLTDPPVQTISLVKRFVVETDDLYRDTIGSAARYADAWDIGARSAHPRVLIRDRDDRTPDQPIGRCYPVDYTQTITWDDEAEA